MSKIARLPWRRRLLLLRALAGVVFYRAALSALPFSLVRTLSARRARPRAAHRVAGFTASDLAWAVRAASRRVPRASCLTQALALRALMARESLASDLHIGVARDEDGRFEAHAWLEADGRVLIGGGELERFTPLARVTLPVR